MGPVCFITPGPFYIDIISPWKSHFDAMISNGAKELLPRVNPARKIASTILALWKKEERYNEKKRNISHLA